MRSFISPSLLRSVLFSSLGLVGLQACGAKTAADDAATTTTSTATTASTIASAVNALAAAYPGTLALSVLPSSTKTSLALADEIIDPGKETYTQKIENTEKRLKGEGDCFTAGQIAERENKSSGVTCYEFDSDMNPSRFTPGDTTRDFGTTDGTDGKGQACMVSFAKSQVDDITNKVDRALAMVQGVICRAKKVAVADGKEVAAPTVDGAAVDLKVAVNAGLPPAALIKFTKAETSAKTNPDGTISYLTEIVLTNPFGTSDLVTLRHTPAAVEGGDESGILTIVREPLGAKATVPSGDPNQEASKYDVMSIQYKKSTKATIVHMNAELTRAAINKKYAPVDSKGLVNFAAVPDEGNNGDIHAIKYVAFDIVPKTGAGDLSYWMNPGGNKAESARGFLFNLTATDAGLLTGCGISGATNAVSIRASALDSTKILQPVRFWHPRENQNVHPSKDSVGYPANEGNSITEQCFSQNAAGLYVIDAVKTTSAKGYTVKATSNVKPPERPPVPNLPPPPPLPAPKA